MWPYKAIIRPNDFQQMAGRTIMDHQLYLTVGSRRVGWRNPLMKTYADVGNPSE